MATTVQEIINYVLKTPLNTNKAILTEMLYDLSDSNPDGIVQLRRDNDYNYEKVADTFIPLNGEICLVDTAKDGLRAKCGDGSTVWRDLDYIDEFVVKGYYNDGSFYKDSAFKNKVEGATHKLYIDLNKKALYFFNEDAFVAFSNFSGTDTTATEDTAGIMKLYQNTGRNEDGTMSQKAIMDELDDKVECEVKEDEELLVLVDDNK